MGMDNKIALASTILQKMNAIHAYINKFIGNKNLIDQCHVAS